jgi:hypothetical protein
MVKIRFTQDRVVQDGDQGTPHETRFSAGQVVDLAEASANHWLSRGAAERVLPADEPTASTAAVPTPAAASHSSAATQPSLDLTGGPVSDTGEQQPAADGDAGGSSDEASADASEPSAEEVSEVQPGLGLAGASEADGEKPGKSERKPARVSAKGSKV